MDANGNPTDSGISKDNVAASTTTRLGMSTTAVDYGTALGRNTKAAAKAVAIGACDDTLPTNASGQGSIAIGFRARAENDKPAAISIGAYSKTQGEGAIAIGGATTGSDTPTVATADGAAQIGPGNNDKPNSLKFRDTEIVDGNGKIPSANLDVKVPKLSVDNTPADVNIVHISQEDYEQLVIDGNALSNTLYVVSGDYINTYGQ